MQNDRRRFIKLTGITSAGLLTGLHSFSGPFDFLPPDQQDFVFIHGLFPSPDSIQETGFHLRWILPPSKGIPDVITIFRRGGDKSRPSGFSNDPRLCQSGGWKMAATISNKKDTFFQDRISAISRNFYLQNESDRSRYRNMIPGYASIVNALRIPDPAIIQGSGVNTGGRIAFEDLKFRNKRTDMPDMSMSAYDILSLSSLDPNIARILGLYWVDLEHKNPGDLIDYKIEAEYANPFFKGKICGVFLGAKAQPSPKPSISENPVVQQIDEAYWEFNELIQPLHFSKMRISWPVPAASPDPLNEASRVVTYLLMVGKEKPKLILPQIDKEGTRLEYFFNRVPFSSGPLPVRLAGIDLFGQISEVKSLFFTPKELKAPPFPVKLQFRDQVGKRIFLDFEYGAAQYLADPEPASFSIYQKRDRLFDGITRSTYTQVINEGQDATGKNVYSILLTPVLNNTAVYRTVQFIEGPNGKKLPVSARHIFSVASQQPDKIVFVSERPLRFPTSGKVQLEPDPRANNQGWNQIRNNIVANRSFRNPLKLLQVNFAKRVNEGILYLVINSVTPITRDPSNERSVTDFPANFPDRFTSIKINIEIAGSNLLTDGFLKTSQGQFRILAQNSGDQLIIEGHPQISQGENARVILPSKATKLAVLILENNSLIENKKEGEFLFRCTINEKIKITKDGRAQDKLRNRSQFVIARLLSEIKRGEAQQLQCLVEIAGNYPDFAISIGTPILYFQPYSIDITSATTFSGQAGEALKHSYYAVETIDNSGNRSSLSTIAQLIQSNNTPLATPAPPFPCGNQAARESWLSLPDAKGLSTICMQWNGTGNELRYELARASDQTIVMAHRALWYKGIVYESDENNKELINTFRLVGSGNLFTLTCNWLSNTDPNRFVGGRFLQTGNFGTISRKAFEIVKIDIQGNNVNFLMRSSLEGVLPSSGIGGVFQKQPDYAELLLNEASIRSLADMSANNSIPEGLNAFSLVTPQPLRNTLQFLDQVPGLGRNRYYYKVRSVDAAENRSRWSNASFPIHQMDVRIPPAPSAQSSDIFCLNKRILLYSQKQESDIKEYIVLRKQVGTNLSPVEYRLITARLTNKPLMCSAGQFLRFAQPLVIPVQEGVNLEDLVSTSLLIDLIKPGQTERIHTSEYDVLFQFDPQSRRLILRGVNFKTKRDGGRKYKLSFASLQVVAEDSYWHFIDDQGLVEGQKYIYELRAVRMPGPSGSIRIKSEPLVFSPIELTENVSSPIPDVVLQWTDASGNPWNGNEQLPRMASFTITRITPGTRISIKKYATTDLSKPLVLELIHLNLSNPVLITDGIIKVGQSDIILQLRDMELLQTAPRKYIIQIINSKNILSDDIVKNFPS